MRALLRDIARLTKLPISLTVTLTTAMGFLLRAGAATADLAWCVAGTVLAAAASSAFNHVQDASADARMARTAGRPIPTGRIDRANATFLAAILALLGFAALATVSTRPLAAMALTAFAMFWYNVVYARLKRLTAFAVVPGAAIGSIPPMVGWVSAGGAASDTPILLVATLLFLWQVPHFWLLVMVHGEEYVAAGLPSLTERFDRATLGRLTYAWVLAAAVFAPGVTALVSPSRIAFGVVTSASIAISVVSWPLARGAIEAARPRVAFGRLNAWMVTLVVTLSVAAVTYGPG